MKIQLIRNATMKISYAGRTILTDPMLSRKGEIVSFAGIAPNPTVELPVPVGEVVGGIDAVLVSHAHPDHFDPAAVAALPKGLAVFCQPGMEELLTSAGFEKIQPVGRAHVWEGLTLTRTGGRHGEGPIRERMGDVSGFVFRAEGEPTVYWVGDSVWCEEVAQAIRRFSPDVIITHSGGATLPGFDPIIMDGGQTLQVLQASPAATVVAVHMEALDHCPMTRAALRHLAEEAGIPASRLRIPADGDLLAWPEGSQ